MKTKIYHRIADVPEADWEPLRSRASAALSRTFWQVLEDADLEGFSYRYAVLHEDGGQAAGIFPLYTVTTDIAIFAPAPLRRMLGRIRRRFPAFLKWTMLECGTPITIVSPPFVHDASVTPGAMVDQVATLLLQVARREGHLLVVVRDFEEEAQALRGEFVRHGFHWIQGLPNTYLELPWKTPEAYLDAMRSYYRSKLLRHRRRSLAQGIRHELRTGFAGLAGTLCAQWRVVHEHAKEFQREVLTPAFYREFSRQMGEDALVLLFYQGDALAGHALLLRDGPLLRWLYVGRTRPGNDGLYLYIAQTVVETAIRLGAERLEMGLTTYAIKQDLGARTVPVAMALRAARGWMNPFVGLGYRLLNRVPAPAPRAVFQTPCGSAAP